ncbi:unnamed protein product [Cunninghamella blakesleeana]
MPLMLKNLSKVYNIPSIKAYSIFTVKPSKSSVFTNQCKSLSSSKYFSKHVSTTSSTMMTMNNNNKMLSIWPRSSSFILSSSTHNHHYLNSTRNGIIFQRQQLLPQSMIKRTFIWYRIPLMILAASNTKRKMILSGIIGGTALVGFIFGPLSLLVIGGIASLVTIRLWRQTRDWWHYIPAVTNTLSNQSSSFYSMLRSQVGQHRAEDQVRQLAIEKIKQWAHTNQGRNIFLNEFNVDHVNDLTFLPNHATAIFASARSSSMNEQQQNDLFRKQISIQFWVESEDREDSGGGGGCMVTVDANVDPNNGNITFQQIKLASPSWNVDEFVPLDHRHHEKIIEGCIFIIDKTFKTQLFPAHEGGRITHLKQLKQKNILISIAEENEAQHTPVIKFWDLDTIANNKNSEVFPPCIRAIKIQQNEKPFPVSTFAVLENLSQFAIGLANGTVLLYRLDLTKDKIAKPKVIYEGKEPITGLGFREQTKSTILFIVTTTNIISYNTTASKPIPITLDDQGCGLGCAIMTDTQDMVVGRDEAIYLYDPTGRGPCFAYDSPKVSLTWFKSNYLIIVSPPVTTASHFSSSSRSFGISSDRNHGTSDLTKITIFDTANKFVAYASAFPGGIRNVLCEWNSIWIVGFDGKLYRLDEKDTPTKLEILFKLNLYVLAINLAHMQKYDDASIADIFKKYGDHLYTRANYDGAMEQYIRTIGQLEPSYVIRKFLDAQRIYNLTNYLQELHVKGLANADHTTLLLNCYTKLKDVSRLDQFIKTDADLNFDLETAITVCRQAGYYEHAVYLAKKFGEHDLYLDIVIEDMREYETALIYIKELGPYEADKNLQKYSKTLLSHLPEQTTQALVELCSGTFPKAKSTKETSLSVTTKNGNTVPCLKLDDEGPADVAVISSQTLNDNSQLKLTSKNGLYYNPPSARTYMPSFVDRPDCLAVFLEKNLETRWKPQPQSNSNNTNGTSSNNNDETGKNNNNNNNILSQLTPSEQEERKAIWNTLLELYLMDEQPHPTTSTSITTTNNDNNNRNSQQQNSNPNILTQREKLKRAKEFKAKSLALLKNETVQYDTNQALVLCQLKKFDEGIVYLYEKTEMYTDILRFWMEKQETDKVIEAVRKYGPKDSSLYPMVLSYFSSTSEILSKSTSELLTVLRNIDEKDLLPPIQVVQALSRSNAATIGLLKAYISKKIESERKELQQNEELIKSYQEETEKHRKEIEDLKTSARIFQVQRCTGCNGQLDLPSVHFLCRHSFHQRCLGENDNECPQCAVKHRMISEIRRAQEANADQHDLFFEQLDNEEDGYNVIADYFSKNTMAFAKLID